jgi:HAE1 family hydrophobic/amphiphilic exporter-1
MTAVDEEAETRLAQKISMVSGVSQVSVMGAQKYAVRIDLDPEEMATRGVGFDEVTAAVQRANANRPTGTLQGPDRNFVVQADNGQLFNADSYRPVIIAYRNGNPIRLDEVANVFDGVENDKTGSWFYDATTTTRTIYLSIQKQPGTNTVEVVDAIRALLPQLQASMPPAIQMSIRSDRSQSIRDSIHDVKITLLLTIVLVIIVIFLFLRNISATVIPSLALPASIIGTFAVMYLLGYSLDNLSLMALTLSVGFVVDDAIVMLENIVRHLEMGKTPMEAALAGSKEIVFTIMSMTISLVAVFIPVLFMGGIVGRLLHEFAVTIAVAILVSGFVSISLTPMLAARMLRGGTHLRHGRMYMATEKVFDWSRDAYAWSLRGTLKHHVITMLVSAGLVWATVHYFGTIPKGFIPNVDTGTISATTEMIQGIGYDSMVAHQAQIVEVIRKDPNVLGVTSNAGGGGGRLSIDLQPKGRGGRTLTADEVIDELRRKLNGVPGIRVFLQNPPAIRIGGFQSRSA